MLLEQKQATTTKEKDRPAADEIGKIRIRFRKAGDLRLVSHHDLMHCFERLFRRAEIPFRTTQGFHPKPRMVFALSLALGIVGCDEVVEVELNHPVDAAEIKHRLAGQTIPGLEILDVRSIDRTTKAQPRRVHYRMPVPAGRSTDVPERINALMQSTEHWFERQRPKPRRFNLRPFLHDLHLENGYLQMSLWVTPTGMARPDEVIEILELSDLLQAGTLLERTKLELLDEMKGDT